MNLYEGRLQKPSEHLGATTPPDSWEKRYKGLEKALLAKCDEMEGPWILMNSLVADLRKIIKENT